MASIVNELREVSRSLVRELDMISGRVRSTGFTYTESHTLIELGQRGVLTIKDLTEILVLDKSTVSRTVSSLLKKGLIRSVKNGKDNRHKPIRLTDKGMKALEKIHEKAAGQVTSALGLLSQEQADTALKGIRTYTAALRKSRLQSEFEIRPIRKADNETMARIIRQVMTEYGAVGTGYSIADKEVDNMYEAYNSERASYFVIVKEGVIRGGAGVAKLDGGDKNVCELKKMYFLPEARGIGMGEKLLKLCLKSAAKHGYKQCYLETLGRMPQARGLYEKSGFKPLNCSMGNTGHHKCEAWYIIDLKG